jgi:ABC-type multidrug transport system fused ATPase/permease subunit
MEQFVRLLRYLKPYRWQIAIGLLCLLLATPAQLFHPLVWKFIVDEVIVHRKVGLLLPALGVMVAVHLIGVGLSALRTYLLGIVGQRFVYDLRNELYRKLQSHSLRFFHERRSGDLLARVIGDVDTLQEIAINGVDNIIANALQFIGVAASSSPSTGSRDADFVADGGRGSNGLVFQRPHSWALSAHP